MRKLVALVLVLLGLLSFGTRALALENVLTYRDQDGELRSIIVSPAPQEAPVEEDQGENPPPDTGDAEAQQKAEEEKRVKKEREALEAQKKAAREAAEAEAAQKAARRAELEEQIQRARIQANAQHPSAGARRNVLRSQIRKMEEELESLR